MREREKENETRIERKVEKGKRLEFRTKDPSP